MVILLDKNSENWKAVQIKDEDSHFNLVQLIDLDAMATEESSKVINASLIHGIHVYKSRMTGMLIVWIDVDGPMVNGSFALATQANNHCGYPHTLEHLIFMGSEEYPYKGYLDVLANYSLARGTNAYTDIDHTAYTLETAGSAGFLKLLPSYLDHILFPTLTDSACYTEVHHITADCEDSGVVYSEMQGREQQAESIIERATLKELFNDSAYEWETGGMLADLREPHEEQVENIRAFHEQFYRINNLCLIISGKININDIFQAVESVELKVLVKNRNQSLARPWYQYKLPEFQQSKTIHVNFPSEEENMGSVRIAWRGCSYDDHETQRALSIMWSYLCDTKISYLIKHMVDIDDPYCGNISYGSCPYVVNLDYIDFESVPCEKLELLKPKFFELINGFSEADFDMSFLHNLVKKKLNNFAQLHETNPHGIHLQTIISYFLYGSEDWTQLSVALKSIGFYNEMLKHDHGFWLDLISRYNSTSTHVCIIASPSKDETVRLESQENERIEKRRIELGEKELENLEKKLFESKETNEQPIPPTLINNLAIPAIDQIPKFHATLKNDTLSRCFQGLQIIECPSHFIDINIFVDTSDLPSELRVFLPLYLETFFQLPIHKGNERIEFSEVIHLLNSDLVSYRCGCGLGGSTFSSSGSYSQYIWIFIKCKSEKYKTAVRWLEDLVFNSIFDYERLQIVSKSLYHNIQDLRRLSMPMLQEILDTTCFNAAKSNRFSFGSLVQTPFLKDLIGNESLQERINQAIISLENFRRILYQSKNMRIVVIGDSIECQIDTWGSYFNRLSNVEDFILEPICHNYHLRSNSGIQLSKCVVVTMSEIDSCFSLHLTHGPCDYFSRSTTALRVLLEYFSLAEGDLWIEIRGTGLAYSTAMQLSSDDGYIYFSIYRSPKIMNAYAAAKRIVQKYKNETSFDNSKIEQAKSALICSYYSKRETRIDAAEIEYIESTFQTSYLDPMGSRQFINRIQSITEADLRNSISFVEALFDPVHSTSILIIPPRLNKDVYQYFASLGYTVNMYNSIENYAASLNFETQ